VPYRHAAPTRRTPDRLRAINGHLCDRIRSSSVEGRRYNQLFAALEAIGSGYWDCLESTWLVITDRTAAEIRDELQQHLQDDDRLLVLRYGEGAAWLGFEYECETWLKDNL
jgi:hypothetical protein